MKPRRAASIPSSVRTVIREHAGREAPNECCGFLIGAGRRVDLAIPMTNVDARPRTGFRIDPSEHIAVRRVLRQVVPGAEFIGVYHSHPAGPATPSPRDVAEAHYPDWLFVICGRAGRSIRAFAIRAGIVAAVPIRWRQAPRRRAGR